MGSKAKKRKFNDLFIFQTLGVKTIAFFFQTAKLLERQIERERARKVDEVRCLI